MTAAADRHLLFGLLALQNGIINQVQLVAAFQAWTLDKSRSLADHLEARGDLTGARRALLEALGEVHLEAHEGDVEQSLAALSAGKSTRESLARIGDPAINETLGHVATVHLSTEDDADRTMSYAVGSATSDGQRFRVLRPHARGGLGAVFVALDAELHREVALKQILDHHADDPTSRQRFLIEAEITGGLEHPGIVPVYGLGSYGDGRPYYAMRFIKGDSLKEAIERFHATDVGWVERSEAHRKTQAAGLEDSTHPTRDVRSRSLELRKLLRRFMDVCNAIDYAHSRGVLHRDIKPGNIIVGKHGETLVVDWGLAKPLGRVEPGSDAGERTLIPSSASGSAETLPGSALGTPAYMSPEQARGELDRLGPRSDVYSLGATLYCLLTGRPPFEGDDLGELLRKVQRGDFPPPRQLDPSLDRALEAACLKAMATRAEDRYASCRALAEDIERWMADEPVSAWREPMSWRVLRWLTRHRTGVTAAGAAVVVALAGTGAVLAVQTRANAELMRANADLAVANQKVTRSNDDLQASNARERQQFNLALEAIRLFHGEVSNDFLMKEKPFQAMRTKLLRGAADFYTKLEQRLQDQTDLVSRAALAAAYEDLGDITREIGNKPDTLALQRKAVAIRRELASRPGAAVDDRIGLARGLLTFSTTLLDIGDASATSAARAEAQSVAEAANAAGPASTDGRLVLAQALNDVGVGLEDGNENQQAEGLEKIQRASGILRELVASEPESRKYQHLLASYENNCANNLIQRGRYEEGIAGYQRAIAAFEKRLDPDDPILADKMAKTHNNMAETWLALGRQDRALEEDRLRLALWRKAAEALPNSTSLRNNLAFGLFFHANLLEQTGKLDEALEAFGQARDIMRVLQSEDPSRIPNNLIGCLSRIGLNLQVKGDTAGARRTFRDELDVAEAWAGHYPDNPHGRNLVAGAQRDIGKALLAAGRPSEALGHLRKAEAIHGSLAKDQPNAPVSAGGVADELSRIGLALRDLGDAAGATAAVRRAIGVFEGLRSPESSDLYAFACARATLAALAGQAGSGVLAAEGRAEADKAMALLRRAAYEGYRDPAASAYRTEAALNPLRGRDDFRLLMMDLAFPFDPFARVD